MSEGNTTYREIRVILDAVKIVKWAAMKNTVLKVLHQYVIELCVGEIKGKVYFKYCKVHFPGQVYFIDHKECFNCSIKYTLHNVYFIEQLKHSLWSTKYC